MQSAAALEIGSSPLQAVERSACWTPLSSTAPPGHLRSEQMALPSLPSHSQAAEHMRDTFEQHGSAWFAPCPELHSGPVFHAASEPRQAADPQQQQQQVAAAAADAAASSSSDSEEASSSGEEAEQRQGEQQQQQPAWQSQWAALGWLQDNPLVRLIPCLVFVTVWHFLFQSIGRLHGVVEIDCAAGLLRV